MIYIIDMFSCFSVSWIPRNCNILAHEITKWSFNAQRDDSFTESDMPPEIIEQIYVEANHN